MRTQFVTVDGVSVAYEVLSEEGPTLLLVPGAISNMALEESFPPAVRKTPNLYCRPLGFC